MAGKQENHSTPQPIESEETKDDPHIYKKGHPHLGSTYDMSTISELTRKIYGTDEGLKKPKKK